MKRRPPLLLLSAAALAFLAFGRLAACYAFAALKGPKAMSRLLDLVTDESITVRTAAMEALKKLSME